MATVTNITTHTTTVTDDAQHTATVTNISTNTTTVTDDAAH